MDNKPTSIYVLGVFTGIAGLISGATLAYSLASNDMKALEARLEAKISILERSVEDNAKDLESIGVRVKK